jgi:superfamily II DNA or RNA helicase
MKYVPYDWQKRLLRIYKGRGVAKAFAGTGKTYATILLIKERKYKTVIVAVPTRKLKHQWIEELQNHGVHHVMVETFHILSKERSAGLHCDLLVVDECHRSTSPVFHRLYDHISHTHILGLSATPNKACLSYCGDIIIDVPLEEGQISEFTVYFHAIDLTPDERQEYDRYSESIGKIMGRMRRTPEEKKGWYRERLDSLIFKRRSLVYMAERRIPQAVKLLKENHDKPTLVICKRIEQANILSKITRHLVYHSDQPDEKALDDFQHDRIPVLLSVGMLAEGYDKRNIQCLIIVSTAITEAYHIQSIGRAVRLPDDADIHILLARHTTDEKLLQFRRLYHHVLVGEFSPRALRPKNPWGEQFYLAEEYAIDAEGRVYQRLPDGKQFFKDHPIISEIQRVLNYRAGRFRVTGDGLVLVKSGGKIISVGMLQEPLRKLPALSISPTHLVRKR